MSSNFLIPIGLIIVASFIFFQLTAPKWEEVKKVNLQIDSVEATLLRSAELLDKRNQLNNDLGSIPPNIKEKIFNGMPEYNESTFAKSLIEFEELLSNSRVAITNLGFTEITDPIISPPNTRAFSFSFSMNVNYSTELRFFLDNIALWFKGVYIENLVISQTQDGNVVGVNIVLTMLFFNT